MQATALSLQEEIYLDEWMKETLDILAKIQVKSLEFSRKELSDNLEGKDDIKKALTTTRVLAEKIHSKYKTPKVIPLKDFTSNEYTAEVLLTKEDPNIQQFYLEIENLEKDHAEAMKKLVAKYEESKSIENIHERLNKETEIDDVAGLQTVELEQKKLAFSVNLLGKSEIRDKIYNRSNSAIKDLESKCNTRLDDMLNFANKKFDIDPTSASEVDLQLALMGRKRHRLNERDLLRLYLSNDMAQTVKATGLSENECIKLHDKITKYLALSIQKQQCQRICRSLEDPIIKNVDCDAKSSAEIQEAIAKVGELIVEKNIIDYQTSPALTLFQYDQDILIRKAQKDYIETLLKQNTNTSSYDNIIIQLIMGGGKSKVLLPILALKKSTGDNLSIIEVPEALFKTNLADLNQVSLRLFGQHAFGLYFDRQTPCDSDNLKKLYRQLQYVSTSRGFVVTTRESMASLDLKYDELLNSPPPKEGDREEWKRQVKWLDRIINFRKNKGDVLVDEVDSSLAIKDQINYTVGDRVSVPELHVEGVLGLYKFLGKIPSGDGTLLDLVTKRDPISASKLPDVLNELTKELVNNPLSPLYPYLPNALTQSEKEQLIDYLSNKSKTFPPCLLSIEDPNGKFTFKHLKGQISHLLPHTLSSTIYVNYGPSENPEKSLIEKCVTIPYSGNNEPEENSKDTNHLKTLNLTIQSNLVNGISPEIMSNFFTGWIASAKAELLENPTLSTIDNTYTGLAINAVLEKSGLTQRISKMNLDDQKAMDDLYSQLKNSQEFTFFTLQEQILPMIKIDSKMLTHNPHNHVDMYRSYQGVTGTPSNWRTMHQSITFNASLSLGTDGITTARLKAKNTPVETLDYQSPAQFLKDAVPKLPKPDTFRVIADVRANFQGIKNVDVAKEFAKFAKDYNKTYSTTIKYIKYFDKNEAGMDELYAMSVDNPEGPRVSLKGKTESEIEKLLRCTPNDCFTYYDQKHCRGADIKQAKNATAIVTVDQKTLKDDFYQGIMRMRGFSGSQNVAIFVSNETKKAIAPDKENLDIDDIIQLVNKNQQSKLLQDHFVAALQKMQNLVVADLKSKIRLVDDKNSDEKERLEKIFEPMLMQSLSDQFIESYGSIETYEDTIEIFKQYTHNLLIDWSTLVNEANIQLNDNEREKMALALLTLKNNEIKNCNKQYLHSTQQSPDQTTQSQQEMRSNKQQEQNQKQNMEVDESLYELKYDSTRTWNWMEKVTLVEFIASDPNALFDTPFTDCHHQPTKEQLTYEMPDQALWTFDKSIRRSNNFQHTTQRWHNQYAPCQKQIHTVMMVQTLDGLKATILTYPEAAYIKSQLKKSPAQPPNYIWLTNTQGSLLSGEYGKKPAKENLHPSNESIMQQLQFYNGDLVALQLQDLSGSWLMEDFADKMQYFEENLLPYRMTDKRKFTSLKTKLQALHNAFESVAGMSVVNQQNIHWQQLYPAFTAANINSLKQFYAFCRDLDSGNIDKIATKDNQKYYNSFYFKILQEHGNEKQFVYYVQLIDNDKLKQMLNAQFAQVTIKHNYDSIITLIERDAFANNPEKQALFLQALGEAFKNAAFTEGLYTHASSQTMTKIMQLITPNDKADLLQALSSKQITDLFLKDINIIRLFIDDLKPENFHDQIAKLETQRIPIEGSDWKSTYSFDYLLKDQEKFDYLLKHADKQYLIKLFSDSGEDGIVNQLLVNCTNGLKDNEFVDRMNLVFDILDPNIPTDLQERLWKSAIELSTKNIEGSIKPLEMLSEKLPKESFIITIKSNPGNLIEHISHDYKIKLMTQRQFSSLEKYDLRQGMLYLCEDGQYKSYNSSDPDKPVEGSLFEPNPNDELKEKLKTCKCGEDLDSKIHSEILRVTANKGHTQSSAQVLEFFWEEFLNIPSDKDKHELITKHLSSQSGWTRKTLVEILKELPEKPDFYYELLAFQLRIDVIEAIRTHDWMNSSKLRAYDTAMKENPEYFMPLSEIDFVNEDGEKVLLSSFVKEKCKDDFVKEFNECVAQEEVIPKPKMPKYGFEHHKSKSATKEQKQQVEVEYSSKTKVDQKFII